MFQSLFFGEVFCGGMGVGNSFVSGLPLYDAINWLNM